VESAESRGHWVESGMKGPRMIEKEGRNSRNYAWLPRGRKEKNWGKRRIISGPREGNHRKS